MESILPDEHSKRFVAVLNKKVEIGKLLNALGHMTAGLAGGSGLGAEMSFLNYEDKDGGSHPNISHFNYIVLKADNSNKIRTLRQQLLERGIPFTDFTHTMTEGGSEAQQARTRATPEAELEYYGLCTFGDPAILRELTSKFSLFQ